MPTVELVVGATREEEGKQLWRRGYEKEEDWKMLCWCPSWHGSQLGQVFPRVRKSVPNMARGNPNGAVASEHLTGCRDTSAE